ncbi:MAG TPA: hypothetical protein VHP83_17340 [Aggregatilineaceae bacterium]|nr:hypothetical protein [Aggregatilineaceae bacterium]
MSGFYIGPRPRDPGWYIMADRFIARLRRDWPGVEPRYERYEGY